MSGKGRFVERYDGDELYSVPTDRHHIFHERVMWHTGKISKKIRQTHEFIPRLEKPVHRHLHDTCPVVPTMGYLAMLRVANGFDLVQGDTLGSLENVMRGVEVVENDNRFPDLERRLAGLMVESLDMQRLVLRGNIVETPKF